MSTRICDQSCGNRYLTTRCDNAIFLWLPLNMKKQAHDSIAVKGCAWLHERFEASGQERCSWVDLCAVANRNNLERFGGIELDPTTASSCFPKVRSAARPQPLSPDVPRSHTPERPTAIAHTRRPYQPDLTTVLMELGGILAQSRLP